MIDRTYRCDLCRDIHEPRDLIGLYWAIFNTIDFKRSQRDVEHHLCFKCFDQIRGADDPRASSMTSEVRP